MTTGNKDAREAELEAAIEAIRVGQKGLIMPAYLIAAHRITDSIKFEKARTQAALLIQKYGGKYLTKPGSHRVLGDAAWQPTAL